MPASNADIFQLFKHKLSTAFAVHKFVVEANSEACRDTGFYRDLYLNKLIIKEKKFDEKVTFIASPVWISGWFGG